MYKNENKIFNTCFFIKYFYSLLVTNWNKTIQHKQKTINKNCKGSDVKWTQPNFIIKTRPGILCCLSLEWWRRVMSSIWRASGSMPSSFWVCQFLTNQWNTLFGMSSGVCAAGSRFQTSGRRISVLYMHVSVHEWREWLFCLYACRSLAWTCSLNVCQ